MRNMTTACIYNILISTTSSFFGQLHFDMHIIHKIWKYKILRVIHGCIYIHYKYMGVPILNEFSTKVNQIFMGFVDTKFGPSSRTVETDDLQRSFHDSDLDRLVINFWVTYMLSASKLLYIYIYIHIKINYTANRANQDAPWEDPNQNHQNEKSRNC